MIDRPAPSPKETLLMVNPVTAEWWKHLEECLLPILGAPNSARKKGMSAPPVNSRVAVLGGGDGREGYDRQ